jgi:tetratricopeptide (TPR) repeat protein
MFGLKIFQRKPAEKSRTVENYLVDAIYAFENREFEKAVKEFRVITKAFPEHPLAHLMLGRSLIELRDYEGATDALFKHLRIVPESIEGMIYLGLTYYECGQLESAKERFEQAMQLKKDSLMLRENLAITRIAAGELDEALDELVALHDDRPGDTNVVELIILTLGRLGKWEAAKQYVHRMKETDLALEAE